jgi:hypothetical protein
MGVRKPEIGFVTEHCCIRVVKEAVVLRNLGYNVHLYSHAPNSTPYFSSVHTYDSPFQLENAVKLTRDKIDLWQVHNEPTWPVSVVRRMAGDSAKIVLDYHDSNYWYVSPEDCKRQKLEDASWFTEDVAVSVSDAFVAPSVSAQQELKTRTTKPVAFLPAACPKEFYMTADFPFIGGLVSQGGHSVVTTEAEEILAWRDYRELYSQLKGKKQVYAYSADFNQSLDSIVDKEYIAVGAKLGKLLYTKLLERMGSHTWNLVGGLTPTYVFNYSLPNKLFDAIAAGVPSVVMASVEPGKLVKEKNIGIVVSSAQELLDRWGEHVQARTNLMKYRYDYCMENYISSLTDLYEGII